MPDHDCLQEKIAAYLEFQKELGIEGFYRRAPGSVPALPQAQERAEKPLSIKTSEARTEALSRVPPPGAPHAAPRMASPAAQSLSLFEAPAPRRGPETLDEIRADLGDCQRCKLAAGRKHIVFGQGSPHAQLLFVGEGPGADEDEQGIPFASSSTR